MQNKDGKPKDYGVQWGSATKREKIITKRVCHSGYGVSIASRHVARMSHKKNREEETEEGKKARSIKVDELPSQAEIEQHMLTHIPFRSWCKHCVMGKSVSQPHKG